MLGRFSPRWRAVGVAAVVLVVGGMAATAVSARSDATDKGDDRDHVPEREPADRLRVLDVAKQEAKRRGYKFLINDPGNDLNKQVGVIETWIQQKVDAIESVASEPQVFEKIAAKARKEGITWVTYAASLKNEDATVTWPHYKGGLLLGQEAGRWIKANRPGWATRRRSSC